MNIEPNASIFNTDGLSFPCFDDNMCTIPCSTPRKSKDVVFRSDFPGSKKITIVNSKKDKSKQMTWDDIYENRVGQKSAATEKESQSFFVDDPFNAGTNRLRQPGMSKQRITLAADLTKARTIDRSRLPKKTKSLSSKTPEGHDVKNHRVCTQVEPVVVNWCRTANPINTKRFTDSSHLSEVTSTTSATSLSGEYNEVFHKRKTEITNRCVSRSKTVGGTPSRRMNADKVDIQRTIPRENSRRDFEVDWPSTNSNVTNREQINLKQIRDTPVKTNMRNSTPKRAVSTSRNLRRSSMVGVGYLPETRMAEPRPINTNRRGSLDHLQHATPSKAKPRLYMSVSTPKKNVNMKSPKPYFNEVGYLKNNLRNPCCDNRSKKTSSINSEPLDFSEFDTEDFSTSDDINEGFSMPFKPVEPLYCTSSKNKAFFPSHDDDAEEEAWSALFSPQFG